MHRSWVVVLPLVVLAVVLIKRTSIRYFFKFLLWCLIICSHYWSMLKIIKKIKMVYKNHASTICIESRDVNFFIMFSINWFFGQMIRSLSRYSIIPKCNNEPSFQKNVLLEKDYCKCFSVAMCQYLQFFLQPILQTKKNNTCENILKNDLPQYWWGVRPIRFSVKSCCNLNGGGRVRLQKNNRIIVSCRYTIFHQQRALSACRCVVFFQLSFLKNTPTCGWPKKNEVQNPIYMSFRPLCMKKAAADSTFLHTKKFPGTIQTKLQYDVSSKHTTTT